MFADAATEDFFRARLDHMIDLRHPLVVLTSRMPWQQIEASVAHLFSRKARTSGQPMSDLDLFGEAPTPVARQSTRVRHFDPICRPNWDAGVIQIKYLHALMRLFPSICVVPICV